MIFGLRRVHAFSLVEVTLAMGVAAFCLLAVFGLMPIGVQTNRNATSQTRATNIMAAVIADMRATPKTYDNLKTYSRGDSVLVLLNGNGNCYTAITTTTGNAPPNPTYWTTGSACPQFGITFGTAKKLFFDGQGQFTTSLDANSRYQLKVTFPNPDPGTLKTTYADLKVTWPAAVDPATTTPSGSVEMFAAFDRN
jgi:type II secretory pathway pseudopilin PulG